MIRRTGLSFAIALLVSSAHVLAQPADIQDRVAELMSASCAIVGCHAAPVAQQGMDLSPELFASHTVGVPSVTDPDYLRVDPGNPDDSYLYMKLVNDPRIGGAQMPLIGNKLTEEELADIRTWIESVEFDSTLGFAEPRASQPPFDFVGWKVVNLPTNRRIDSGLFLFLIGHRFNPKLSSGYDSFFGLDGSGIIFLNLGYAVTDRLFVNLGRSNAQDDVELDVKVSILDERQGKYPLSLSVHSSLNWISEKQSSDDRLGSAGMKPSFQLVTSKAIGNRAGIAFVPGLLLNPDHLTEGESALLTLGLGGRIRVGSRFAIVGEWVHIASGFARSNLFGNDIRFDSWAGGFEIATSGHVFQIVGSNTVGLTTDQYFRGGDLDLMDGQVRLGFNIFRVLRF